ncbi:TetR/AcrR family transcriptional regulator [Pseudomonas sp. NY15181]|uniref:TetR/AcrR family transcriptional regulator n=1 Tax=Pseudomonas sp. NY15181 TaxID=3400349 RepID=UPI003A89B27B
METATRKARTSDKPSILRGGSAKSTADTIRLVALRLFAREGYQAVSMRQIAEHTGVQVGSIYNHVSGKQELLFELVFDLEKNLHAAVVKSVSRMRDPVPALTTYIRTYIRYAVLNADLHTLSVRESCCLDEQQLRMIDDLRRAHAEFLTSILEEGNRRGSFDIPNVKFIVGAIRALLDGMVGQARARRSDLDCYLAELQELILRSCHGPILSRRAR